MNLILRQHRVLNSTWTWFFKFVEATVSWQSDSCEHGFTRRHTHLVEMTQVPPVEVSEAWRQSLESWRLNLHGLKASHCLFVWSGKKTWVVVKRGGILLTTLQEKRFIILAYSIMMFLLTDSNVAKHIDVLSLGESSENFLGSIFLGRPCDFN